MDVEVSTDDNVRRIIKEKVQEVEKRFRWGDFVVNCWGSVDGGEGKCRFVGKNDVDCNGIEFGTSYRARLGKLDRVT